MLPVYSPDSHSHYQDFFISNFLKYYPDPFSISRQTWKVIIQFWHMDLSETPNILMDSYSKFGPLPRDPASMLRSYLLSIKLKITSVTDWVSKLKECPLYAIISGFSPDDVPGIGTFYGFFWHMWNSDQKHLSTSMPSSRVIITCSLMKILSPNSSITHGFSMRLLEYLTFFDAPSNRFSTFL